MSCALSVRLSCLPIALSSPSSHPHHLLLPPSHSQTLDLPLPPKVGSQLPAIRHTLLLPLCYVWVPSEPGHLAPNLFLSGFSKCSPLIFSYAFARFLCLPHGRFLQGFPCVWSSYQLLRTEYTNGTTRSWSPVSHLSGNGLPHQVTSPS